MFRQKRITRFIVILLAVVFFCASAGLSAADDEGQNYVENEWNFVDGSMNAMRGIPDDATGVLDRIRRKGVLRVATEPYYPPQEFIDPDMTGQDQYAGADMKLARLIAARMGVKLEIIPMEFTQVLPALAEDQCDLTISALSYTPARATSYSLSKGYYFADIGASTGFIIREADREKIASLDDLADKILIAQSSSLQETLAANHVRSYKEFRRISAVQTVYDAVRTGRADAGVVDITTAENYIKNNPGCGLCMADGLTFSLDEEYRGDRIAAKKGETMLLYFVNGVIDEVLKDGTYMQWFEEARKRAEELGM
jgi:polar amino acid transport system substrate-binding protein